MIRDEDETINGNKDQVFKFKYFEMGMGLFLLLLAGLILIDSSLTAFDIFIYIILVLTVNILVTTILSLLILLSFGVLFKPKGMKMLYLISWGGIFVIITLISLTNQFLVTTILEEATGFGPDELINKLQAFTIPITGVTILIGIVLIYYGYQQHRTTPINDAF